MNFPTPPTSLANVKSAQWPGVNCDLTWEAVSAVVKKMDVEPQQCELFCSRGLFSVAREIWSKLGIAVVLVPGEILKYPGCWAVRGPNEIIWMEVPH